MYRINLHPEHVAAGQAARRRVLQVSLAAALLGAEVLLVGGLLLSATLLDERVEASRRLTESMEADLKAAAPLPEKDVALARAILAIRSERIDWSPQLAAISETIGSQLILSKLTGRSSGVRRAAQLEIEGQVRSEAATVDETTDFVQGLRGDERVARVFARCDLGQLNARGVFSVTCRPAEVAQ